MTMYELTGKIQGFSQDFATRRVTLTLTINEDQDAKEMFDELRNADKLSIMVDKFREKRSTEANSYFWVLCGKLAAELGQRKLDIYRSLIRDIGNNFVILPLRNDAVDQFIENWQRDERGRKRLGWICDIVGESKIEGYTNVCAYYGSSSYDSKQMNALIQNVVDACQEHGISTKTPQEIARLIDLWRNR